MKNKEIEELLNRIKNKYEDYYIEDILSDNDLKLLLSYIEQLEKRNKQLYEGFMATQEELTDYATENEQLKKQKDDVVEYIKNTYNNITKLGKRDLLRMLGEIE